MLAKKDLTHAAFLIGPGGKITTWNVTCQRLLGYAEDDVLLRPITVLLSESVRKACQDYLRALPGDAEKVAMELILADGRSSLFNLTFVPQFRKSGKLSGYSVLLGPAAEFEADPESRHDARSESERKSIRHAPLKDMVNFLAGTFYVINQSGNFVMWNKRVEQVTKRTNGELKALHVLDLFNPQEKERVANKIREVFEHDGEVIVEAELLAKDGTSTPYIFTGSRFISDGQPYLCGMGLDLTERHKKDEQIRLRERALHAIGNGVLIIRCAGKKNPIEYVNPAFEQITGYQASEILGRDSLFMAGFLAAPGLDESEQEQLREAINERAGINVIFRNLRKNGELFWNDFTMTPVSNEKGVATHFIGVINDVTASKHRTSHLEHEVNHDALTGLANRNLLWDRLEQALHIAQRNKTLVATVLVDLDNFKDINDTLGHDAGDEVLKVVARRLQTSVRDSDTVARLGGDEFVLILYDQPSLRFTLRMIERLRQDMTKPVIVDSREVEVRMSMGVSVFPHDGASAVELLQAADVAMYHAKAAGRNDVHFFSADMKLATEAKQKLEVCMRKAIERDELFLVFQPKICLRTGMIVGAEALLRWRHPEQGVLLPASFIPDAEENGLIIPFGEWVFNNICQRLQRLRLLDFHKFPVSMNVSFRELSQKNYIELLGKKLKESNLSPDVFELEIREAYMVHNPKLAREIFSEIRQLGIKLTIDEFGSGVSSLSNLHTLPINYFKIPRAVVNRICKNSADDVLAKTMIGIGHNLNINVIAEGVENDSQMNFLKLNNCDGMQGNYFSEPVPFPEFEKLLKERSSSAALVSKS